MATRTTARSVRPMGALLGPTASGGSRKPAPPSMDFSLLRVAERGACRRAPGAPPGAGGAGAAAVSQAAEQRGERGALGRRRPAVLALGRVAREVVELPAVERRRADQLPRRRARRRRRRSRAPSGAMPLAVSETTCAAARVASRFAAGQPGRRREAEERGERSGRGRCPAPGRRAARAGCRDRRCTSGTRIVSS